MKKTSSDVSPWNFGCIQNHNKAVIYKTSALDINEIFYKTRWCNSAHTLQGSWLGCNLPLRLNVSRNFDLSRQHNQKQRQGSQTCALHRTSIWSLSMAACLLYLICACPIAAFQTSLENNKTSLAAAGDKSMVVRVRQACVQSCSGTTSRGRRRNVSGKQNLSSLKRDEIALWLTLLRFTL